MVVVKILCGVALGVWLVYELVQLGLAIKDRIKRKKQNNEQTENHED